MLDVITSPADEVAARPDQSSEAAGPCKDRYLTIPNVICVARIIGSLGLIWLALAGATMAFLIGFFVLHLSDWIDGKVARWMNQQSDFGARLDSASDAILYACLIAGSLILKWDILQEQLVWLAVPLISYAATTVYGLKKYGQVPSYHTYGAKISNWLVLAGAAGLLLDWSLWPLILASIGVTLTNFETIAITCVLPKWRADVLTVVNVLPRNKNQQ